MFKKMALFALLVASCSYNTSSLQGGQLDGGGVVTEDTGTSTLDTMVSMDAGGAALPNDAVIADTPTVPDTFIASHTSTNTSTSTTPDAGPTIPDVLPVNPDTTVATDVQITQTDTTLAAGCTLDQQEVDAFYKQGPSLASFSAYLPCGPAGTNSVWQMCTEVPGCVAQLHPIYSYITDCSGTRTPCDQLTTKEQCLSSRKTDLASPLYGNGANCLWNGSKT